MENADQSSISDVERQLRLTVIAAWQEFAKAKRIARDEISQDGAAIREAEAFWCYQRAMKRFSDVVVHNHALEEVPYEARRRRFSPRPP